MYYIQNGEEKIIINSNGIIELKEKHFTFRYAFRLGSSINRAMKYVDRGFTMTNNIKYKDFCEDMYKDNIYYGKMGRKGERGKRDNYEYMRKDTAVIDSIKIKYCNYPCENNCPIKFFGSDDNHVHCMCGRYNFILIMETRAITTREVGNKINKK